VVSRALSSFLSVSLSSLLFHREEWLVFPRHGIAAAESDAADLEIVGSFARGVFMYYQREKKKRE